VCGAVAALAQPAVPSQKGAVVPRPEGRVDYTNDKLVEVTLTTPGDLAAMLAISGHFWGEGVGLGVVPFYLSPPEFDELVDSGLSYNILHDDVQELIDAQRATGVTRAWFDDYKNYAAINAYIDTLVAQRPDLVSKLTIGTSHEGRTIYGMKITSAAGDPNKPAVFFNGCQHAREWISPMTNMYIADQLVQNYGADAGITAMVDDLIFYIIPIVNPDGYEYSWNAVRNWRKNRRNNGDGTFGVDLNRNWPFAWGGASSSSSTSNDLYRGPSPASEPETQALTAFLYAHPEIISHVDFHSYGQLILYEYGHITNPPDAPEPDYTRFVTQSADMAAAILAEHGKLYIDQEAWEQYPAGGTMPDWVYDTLGILSWTIELRPVGGNPGFLLPANEIIPTGEENFEAIKVLVDFARMLLDFTFPAPLPNVIEADAAADVFVDISEINASIAGGSETLFARIGTSGAYTAYPLISLGGDRYQGSLPAAPCGEVVQYYFSAQTTSGATVTEPPDAPSVVFQADALEVTVTVSDDMEAASGWTVGGPSDTATLGIWNRMDPEGTAAQPENDHSASGTDCWVTDGFAGESLGTNDVDGGQTTLNSPVFDLTGTTDPTVGYWRWYSNDTGGAPNLDTFVIEISDDGVTWINLETVGPAGAETGGGWYYHEARVLDFVSLTSQVQVRFIASDVAPGSVVEAAVDDFDVHETGCGGVAPCPGDVNGDNTVDITDLGILLANFGTGSAFLEDGDLSGDGSVDITDLGILLAEFGSGC
jgi:hypothetical protein